MYYKHESTGFNLNDIPIGIKEAIMERYDGRESFDVNSLTKPKKRYGGGAYGRRLNSTSNRTAVHYEPVAA